MIARVRQTVRGTGRRPVWFRPIAGAVAAAAGIRPLAAVCAAALTALALSAGCGDEAAGQSAHAKPPDSAPFTVFVSIPPQAWFVERIAGGHVQVEVLVQPGQNPHNFDATPQQVVRLARARACLTIGLEFEPPILKRIESEGGPRVIRTQEGVELLTAEHACSDPAHNHGDHNDEHPDSAEHGHGAIDPHIWLDPQRAARVATNTRDALITLDPEHRQDYESNTAALLAEIDALHHEIAGLLAPYAGREFFVYHPAYGYFAAAYKLKQVAIEREGKAPQGRELTEIIRRMQTSGTKTIFYEPQFDRSAMDVVAGSIGARAVVWDGLSRDWPGALRQAARDLKASFEGAKP